MSPMKLLQSIFTSAPRVSPVECSDQVRAGQAILVDVREPAEWRQGVAARAVLLPLSDLTGRRAQWSDLLAQAKDRAILLYCASGGRSSLAARILVREGFQAANTGGLNDWADIGWPIDQAPGRN